jgi:hypothetical protein
MAAILRCRLGSAASRRALLRLAALALAVVLLLARPAAAQYGPVTIGFNTFTNSTTFSEVTVVVVPGSGPLTGELQRVLSGPNGNLIANVLLSRIPGSSQNLVPPPGLTFPLLPFNPASAPPGVTINTYTVFGPDIVVFGPSPGTVNCNGPPPAAAFVGQTLAAAAPNCNFAGYQQFIVGAADTEFDTNFNFELQNQFILGAAATPGINWLLGDLHTEFQTAILDGDFNFVDGLLSHARGGPGGMLFSANPMQFADAALADAPAATTGPWRLWAKGDYASANFAGTASNFGFGYSTGGGEAGIDYRMPDWVVGGAFAYDHADVTQDTTADHGTIGSWRLGAYASWQPGPWSFTGVVAGGFHNISANRLTLLPMPAASSYAARSVNVAGEVARSLDLGMATLQPMAGLVYTDLNVDGFAESGGLLDLNGRAADIAALRGYAGARLYQSFDLANGRRLTPELRARVLYDFLNDPRALTASFVDDPTQTQFLVTGLQPARLAGLIGAMASVELTPQWRGFVSYDAELRGGDVAHFVTAGLKLKW